MTTRPDEHRLLAVFAHPDDETIGSGALLALAVDAGVDVSVVTCTRGERGEVIPPQLAQLAADPDALAQHREAELSAALAELGAHRHLFLDQVPGPAGRAPVRMRDSGMAWVRPGVAGPVPDAGPEAFTAMEVDDAARLLAVVIRHVCPTAVLTEEPGGGYGHPDHVHAHRVTMRAVELAAQPASGQAGDPLAGLAPWRVPTVLWAAQEEEHLRAALTELGDTLAHHEPLRAPDGTVLTTPDPAAELPPLAVPASGIAASFDVRPVAGRVLAALRRHQSQIQAVAPIDGERLVGHLALSNASLVPVLDRAYLRAAPGYDAGPFASALTPGSRPVPGTDDDGAPDAGTAAALTMGARPPRTIPPDDAPQQDAAAERPRRGLSRLLVRGGGAGVLVAVLAGLVMATLGTIVHRYEVGGWPLGVVVALLGVLAAAVTARALAGGGGLLVVAIAVVVTTQTMTFMRPGGDILVTDELLSYVWLFGAPVMCFVVAVLPRRWFADRPRTHGDRAP